MGKPDQTNRSFYQQMKDRCEKLERDIEKLKSPNSMKDTTIAYLIDLSETCCKAAGMLIDQMVRRDEPAKTAVTTVPFESREAVMNS